jgi:lysophospholipase L1-like esterase
LVLWAVPAVAAAQAAAIPYTALGDSYSSGEGNDPFDGSCHRAQPDDSAYPRILPSLVTYVTAPNFHACTGAVTADIWEHPQPHRRGQRTQTDYVSPTDRLVTITIGGNDLGFASVLLRCLLPDNCTTTKLGNVVPKVDGRLSAIQAHLERVYTAIRAAMDRSGYLVVAGYPHIFTPGPNSGCKHFISSGEAAWVNGTVDRANAKIEAAVASAQASAGNVFYVEVENEFDGHELCTDSPWLYGIAVSRHEGPTLVKGSYHPTEKGQHAYATAFAAFLNRPGVRSALTACGPPRSAC